MHIRVRYMCPKPADKDLLLAVAKTTTIDAIKKLIEHAWKVSANRVKLYYQGKSLFGSCRVHDYGIRINDVVQLIVTPQPGTLAIEMGLQANKTAECTSESTSTATAKGSNCTATSTSTSTGSATANGLTISSSSSSSSSASADSGSDSDSDDEKDPMCGHCRHDDITCNACGCQVCGLKLDEHKIVLCDECNQGYHVWCLTPALLAVPPHPDPWYCPSCKTNIHEIVKDGESQTVSVRKAGRPANLRRNNLWGKGMACVGKTTECTIVPMNHFGPIPNVDVGTTWKFRIQVAEAGVHRPPVAGIHGRETEGAYSLVLSGGYADDEDEGERIIYTGSGGRDYTGNRRVSSQSCHQSLTRMNKALALNCNAKFNDCNGAYAENWKKGKPVRVVRNYKLGRFSKYAPKEGNRYDGIYKVVMYYKEMGKAGFYVWKFVLMRDDLAFPPWNEFAPTYPMIYPPGYEAMQTQSVSESPRKREKHTVPKERSSTRMQDDPMALEIAELQNQSDSLMASTVVPTVRRRRCETVTRRRRTRKARRRRKPYDWPDIRPRVESPSMQRMMMQVAEHARQNNKPTILTHVVDGKVTLDLTKTTTDTKLPCLNQSVAYALDMTMLGAIARDTLNKNKWRDCTSFLTKGKRVFLDKVTEYFQCSSCYDLACKPVTTPCTHNHCLQCIKMAFATKYYLCPTCRYDVGEKTILVPNWNLLYILETLFPGYTEGRE